MKAKILKKPYVVEYRHFHKFNPFKQEEYKKSFKTYRQAFSFGTKINKQKDYMVDRLVIKGKRKQ
jgi:hypothetical protein